MGTITSTTVLDKAAILLFDTNNVKWARSELLGYLNDGQRAIVAVIPEANSVTQNLTLVAGSRQTLPTGANMLLEITRNMGATGTTPGRMLKLVDRAVLNESNPAWQSDPTATTTTLYMYNLRDRYAFYVYPQATAGQMLEAVLSMIPTDIVEPAVISISDIFQPALLDYILWRAYSKDAPYASANKAAPYFQSFTMFLQANAADSSKIAQSMGQLMPPTPQQQGSVPGG